MRILLVLLLSSTCLVVAQEHFGTGVYSASGSLGVVSSSREFGGTNQEATSVIIAPTIAYFLVDHLELLMGPSYVYSSTDYTNIGLPTNSITSTSIGIQVGLRYYFGGESYSPFVGMKGGLSWSKVTSRFSEEPFSPASKTYAVEAGLDYFIAPQFAIEPSLQYSATMLPYSHSYTETYVLIGAKYFIQ